MQWIFDYQLFLFDFDGLLVDTEQLHYQAYIQMCAKRGFKLDWNFQQYSQAAHHTPTGLRDKIYSKFPQLELQEPHWQTLYQEKKRFFLDLVDQGNVSLMPGVADLLIALQKANIKRCVVTHSAAELIHRIRQQNPILNTIPHWLTREDYVHPKPHAECYLTAIAKFSQPHDQIIGFEDSPRGLHALLGSQAKPVLVCPPDSPYLSSTRQQHPQVCYYPTFANMLHQTQLSSCSSIK